MTQQIVHQADFMANDRHINLAVGILRKSENAVVIKAIANVPKLVKSASERDVLGMIESGNDDYAAIQVLDYTLPRMIGAAYIGEPYKKALEQLAAAVAEIKATKTVKPSEVEIVAIDERG